jgi:hypothetical protein
VRLTPRQAYLLEASVKCHKHRLARVMQDDTKGSGLREHATRKYIELTELLRALGSRPTRYRVEEP